MDANELFDSLSSQWGCERDKYFVEIPEMEILLQGGAKVIFLNQANGNDDNLLHKVSFRGKEFITVSFDEIQNPQR